MASVLADVREMVSEQRDYRELLRQITKRDLLLRYKQTVMGFGWAVFMPVVNTIIFSVIFTRVAPLDVGVPYPLFAYTGLLAWNFTASSLRFAVNSLTSNTTLVTKVYFPREVLPVSAVLVSLVDFAVGAVVLVALMAYYGSVPSWTLAFLPVVVAVQAIFTLGVSLLLAMANLFYRDVKYLFEVAIQVWMFSTSVLYPLDQLGGKMGEVIRANPMTAIIDAYRDIILHGTMLETGRFGGAAVVSVVFLGVSWLLFHRSEFKFAENV